MRRAGDIRLERFWISTVKAGDEVLRARKSSGFNGTHGVAALPWERRGALPPSFYEHFSKLIQRGLRAFEGKAADSRRCGAGCVAPRVVADMQAIVVRNTHCLQRTLEDLRVGLFAP